MIPAYEDRTDLTLDRLPAERSIGNYAEVNMCSYVVEQKSGLSIFQPFAQAGEHLGDFFQIGAELNVGFQGYEFSTKSNFHQDTNRTFPG
jgi:hypothetical protein